MHEELFIYVTSRIYFFQQILVDSWSVWGFFCDGKKIFVCLEGFEGNININILKTLAGKLLYIESVFTIRGKTLPDLFKYSKD